MKNNIKDVYIIAVCFFIATIVTFVGIYIDILYKHYSAGYVTVFGIYWIGMCIGYFAHDNLN